MRVGLLVALLAVGCYHYEFHQRPVPPGARLVEHEERVAKYVNGFFGAGTVDTTKYCADPVRTELTVTAVDVLLSVVTILIYTPHTLTVVCAE